MESRIEMRKKDFKKTFDDPRRRREEVQVQIRKQTRDERFAKKRQQVFDELRSSDSLQPVVISREDLDQIPILAQVLRSNNDSQELLKCCQQFRKLLSIEKAPPIQEVIDAGIIPRLIDFLRDDTRQSLQFESAWALTNIASGTQAQTKAVIDHGAVPIFVKLLSSSRDDIREQAVWALGNIAGDSPDFRDLVLKSGGLNPLLHQIRLALQSPTPKVTMLRNATWTLSNCARGKPRASLDQITSAIPIIKELIFSTDVEVLTDACWALSYISDGNNDDSEAAIDALLNNGLATRLVQLLGHSACPVITPALRTIGNIVSGTECQTQVMISSGCIPALRCLLGHPKKLIRKEACWSISNITAGNRQQIQEVIRENIIPTIMELVRKADIEVKREAYWALANALSGATPEQIRYLLECQVLTPLVEALGFKDEKLVGVSLEALAAILKTGETLKQQEDNRINPYAHLLELAGAYPKLEELQYASPTSKIYQLAMSIMTNYLAFDEDVEENNLNRFDGNQNERTDNVTFDFSRNME